MTADALTREIAQAEDHIEAVTGQNALAYLQNLEDTVGAAAGAPLCRGTFDPGAEGDAPV